MNQHQRYLRIRALAREMRKNATEAEDFFWEKVRDRRLFGLKINRQFIIQCPQEGNFIKYYIADFYCHSLQLVIELDGSIHLKQQNEDLIRTEQIVERGFKVIRFSNDQILNNWEEVEEIIRGFILTHPQPLS